MKHFLFVILILVSYDLFSQNSGRGFSYQAVARSGDGQIKASTNIELQFSLLPGANAINPTWQETHVATTDEFGICNLIIGTGLKSGGTVNNYKDLDYSIADYWLKVELKDNGSFQEIHKMQLLSVPYAEVSNKSDGVPIGTILAFGADTNNIPNGYLLCDGKQLNRGDFSSLYKIIGSTWGAGNGTTTFHLPDLRGLFLRGVALGKNIEVDKNSRFANNTGGNTGDKVGSEQSDTIQSHSHKGMTNNDGEHVHKMPQGDTDQGKDVTFAGSDNVNNDPNDIQIPNLGSAHKHSFTTDSFGGKETRPVNANVHYIIKVK